MDIKQLKLFEDDSDQLHFFRSIGITMAEAAERLTTFFRILYYYKYYYQLRLGE